jgi:hypothetical protein
MGRPELITEVQGPPVVCTILPVQRRFFVAIIRHWKLKGVAERYDRQRPDHAPFLQQIHRFRNPTRPVDSQWSVALLFDNGKSTMRIDLEQHEMELLISTVVSWLPSRPQ